MKKNEIISVLMIISTILCSIVSRSCANTRTPPSGGPKDTLPPTLLEVSPANKATNFPITGEKIVLEFDEYTVIKLATDIYISPIPKKRPTVRVRNKNIEVLFNDTLQENTTYTIDFGKALADNNEGNPFPRYVYSFSTGNEIDSMYLTGTLVDCEKLLPVPGALVALYTSSNDSVCMQELPVAATKTDDWGYFVIRNIKPDNYRIFAFTDTDGDNKYTIGADKIAFYDSLFTPTKIVNDSIYELQGFDMSDTLACNSRESEIELRMFQEYSSKQYILEKGRPTKNSGYITFASKDAVINSFKILGIDSTKIITQTSINKDSLRFWINERGLLPDSLFVTINYLKTDSTNQLSATNETLSLAMTREALAAATKPDAIENAKNDTTFSLTQSFEDTMVEQDGIKFYYELPLTQLDFSTILLTSVNQRNQIDTLDFIWTLDSLNICSFTIQAKEPYQVGYKYTLNIPENIFTDVNGRKNKSTSLSFSLPNADNYSTITLNISNVQTRYIIELVNKDKTKTFRKFIIDNDTSLLFPYVTSDSYSLRITEDRNRNGVFDSGNMLKNLQPEKVTIFKIDDGSEVFFIPEQTDVIQDIIL